MPNFKKVQSPESKQTPKPTSSMSLAEQLNVKFAKKNAQPPPPSTD